MVQLTLFEIHLDGSEFTANAPFSSASAEEAEEAEDGDWEEFGSEAEGGGPNPLKLAVLALVVSVVVTVVVRKLVGGDEADEE